MDNVTKAKINLFAVLRNIEDLCELDKESKELVKNTKLSVSFNVPEVGCAVLIFKGGKCEFIPNESKAGLKLWFNSPEHFNKLMNGENTIPLFINVFKVGFLLKTFTKLAERLSYFLQPKSEDLFNDREFFEINTKLTAFTAFFALCQVGNSDSTGKKVAARMSNSIIACGIPGVLDVYIKVEDHIMTAYKGENKEAIAFMEFADIDFAHNMLSGKESSYAGLGSGKFKVKGVVGVLNEMSKLLNLVSVYLQ
ncbi:MAG: hypothetical protein WCR54_01160 [Clostridia bacterium]